MNNKCYFFLATILCLQLNSLLAVTTAIAFFCNPLKRQRVTLIYDTHYESYHEVKNPKLKSVIQQQIDELSRIIEFLSQQEQPSRFIVEDSREFNVKTVKAQRRHTLLSTVANVLCEDRYADIPNLIYLPLDYRCWIDLLMYQYTSKLYIGMILFKNDPKDYLEKTLKDILHFDKLTISQYIGYINFCYLRVSY